MGFVGRLAQFEKSSFARLSAEAGYLLPDAGPLSIDRLSQQACRNLATDLRLKALALTKKSSGEHQGTALPFLQCRLLKVVASILSERAPWKLCQVITSAVELHC